MAGAGQPWYMPLFFPVGNLITIAKEKVDGPKPPKPVATPQLDLEGNLTSIVAATRSFLMALLAVYVFYDGYDYPAFGGGKTLSINWMLPIILRSLAGTLLIAGTWDWILYFSPFKNRLAKYKFTQIYPSIEQLKHDIFWTFVSTIFGSFVEIFICYMYSNNYFKYDNKSLLSDPVSLIKNILFIITLTHWRVAHFWFIHRMLHPWKFGYGIPDVGKFLYKHVHALHHKSYNPTAFSGTNMHPVESTLYYSAALCAIPFGVHPTIPVACIIDCAVGAWLGHDGFQWPGSGDYFHQLHHLHFDCNYGAMHCPLDKWFGTFVASKDDLKKIWGKKSNQVGKRFNETVCKVHPAGQQIDGKKD